MHGSLSMKLEKFQELYEEIMDEIRPRANTKEYGLCHRTLFLDWFTRILPSRKFVKSRLETVAISDIM